MNSEILFFNQRDGPYYPYLKLLHECTHYFLPNRNSTQLIPHTVPDILPALQVDKGAIRFVLSGAHIMCPGLTSPGARMDIDVDKETVVAIYAEGKEHALGVGFTTMSTQDMYVAFLFIVFLLLLLLL